MVVPCYGLVILFPSRFSGVVIFARCSAENRPRQCQTCRRRPCLDAFDNVSHPSFSKKRFDLHAHLASLHRPGILTSSELVGIFHETAFRCFVIRVAGHDLTGAASPVSSKSSVDCGRCVCGARLFDQDSPELDEGRYLILPTGDSRWLYSFVVSEAHTTCASPCYCLRAASFPLHLFEVRRLTTGIFAFPSLAFRLFLLLVLNDSLNRPDFFMGRVFQLAGQANPLGRPTLPGSISYRPGRRRRPRRRCRRSRASGPR